MRFAALNRQESSGDSLLVSPAGKRGKPTREAQVSTTVLGGCGLWAWFYTCACSLGGSLSSVVSCCNAEAPGGFARRVTSTVL